MNTVISNSSGKPIYEQITTQIKSMIISGELPEGSALPSMRLLAKELRISVITTKRAYSDLERDGFIETVTGKGSFVSSKNMDFVKEEQFRLIEEYLQKAVDTAKSSDITYDELKDILFLLYKIIPDVHVHIFDIVKGAFCSSILMLILLSALEFYFSIADYTSVYGPLASVVVIMISFSLIAETIFIGMYIMFEAHMKRLIIEMKKNNHS